MALLFTILCGAAALSLGYFINYFTTGHFAQTTLSALDAEARYINAIGYDQAHTQSTAQIYILLNQGEDIPKSLSPKVSNRIKDIIMFDDANKRRYAGKVYTLQSGQKLLIGVDISEVSKDFKFMQILGIFSIIFVMIVVFVSYLISVFVVSGTNKIADTARDIMNTGDLSRRVTVGSRWDDLSNMAAVLNMLLDRVQELMHGVRQVSDNIAHDLRTPLTRLRGKIESVKDTKIRTELLDETDQLLSTFNALLRISRIESEKQRAQFTNTNLTEVIEDMTAFYEALAEEKNITLTADIQTAFIHGDRDLLFQAFANLLDNAVKFTPENGDIDVRLYKIDGNTIVEITDTGGGIPPGDIDKIFDRFYRSEKSRSSSGTGLGLSLVRAVIDLHEGNIKVENTNDGLRIITIF